MIYKRNDFSFLLDSLREVAKNYYINDSNIVVNINGEEETNESIITNTRFYTLYCMAYKRFVEAIEQYSIDSSKDFINLALSDYNVFNSFINNCLVEYNMYDTVGTGNISYYPYSSLSDFLFEIFDRKRILINYLNNAIMKKEKIKELKSKF